MPDNSDPRVFNGLPPGRPPDLKPQVPYRIEEWGKGRVYFLPEGRDGPRIAKRGPPVGGTIALYIGEETKLPPRHDFEVEVDGKQVKVKVRVLEEGFVYSREEASDRADAYLRRQAVERTGRARRRAKRD